MQISYMVALSYLFPEGGFQINAGSGDEYSRIKMLNGKRKPTKTKLEKVSVYLQRASLYQNKGDQLDTIMKQFEVLSSNPDITITSDMQELIDHCNEIKQTHPKP